MRNEFCFLPHVAFQSVIMYYQCAEKEPEALNALTGSRRSFAMDIKKIDDAIFAFYLPQFHAIPENDRAWGKGFTEWTNVKKAEPLFEGHYQPRVPALGYYNLLDPQVMRDQASLAKAYGVTAFCYYHYWFKDGKKLLEKPLEAMLKDKKVDMPFIFCWANENWSKRWDGGNSEIICKQDYGNESDWAKHFDYLLEFFKDERYVKVEGKPILIIYKPDEIPNLKPMLAFFRSSAKENGFPDLFIGLQYFCPEFVIGPKRKVALFDFSVNFEPIHTFTRPAGESNAKTLLKRSIRKTFPDFYAWLGKMKRKKNKTGSSLRIYNYEEVANDSLKNAKRLPGGVAFGAFCGWDNTPRNKNGAAIKGASPELFESYLKNLIALNRDQRRPLRWIFINAWNEWGEGAYLEPDEKFGYGYLEAVSHATANGLDESIDS